MNYLQSTRNGPLSLVRSLDRDGEVYKSSLIRNVYVCLYVRMGDLAIEIAWGVPNDEVRPSSMAEQTLYNSPKFRLLGTVAQWMGTLNFE